MTATALPPAILEALESGYGKLPPPPAPYDRAAYERGWRYSRTSANPSLDHLDNAGAPEAAYDGYLDVSTGRSKWHLAWCGVNHDYCPEGGQR